jgi:hypothetical protein
MKAEPGDTEENSLTVAGAVIDAVDWSRYELADGSASRFGQVLAAFVADGPQDARRRLWNTMENHVFSQDDIFSAAEPTICVLLASLIDQHPGYTRIGILDLLFHLVQAASYRDDELGTRCLQKAAAGAWFLVHTAISGPATVAEACIEILDIAAPEYVQFARSTP